MGQLPIEMLLHLAAADPTLLPKLLTQEGLYPHFFGPDSRRVR